MGPWRNFMAGKRAVVRHCNSMIPGDVWDSNSFLLLWGARVRQKRQQQQQQQKKKKKKVASHFMNNWESCWLTRNSLGLNTEVSIAVSITFPND
jgi:hypothetical protein